MVSCPTITIAGIIGKKWTIALLQEITLHREKGFNFYLNRLRGISPKVLSQRFRELEREGLLTRSTAGKELLKTQYRLTRKGEELQMLLTGMKEWNCKYVPGLEGCGTRSCTECGLFAH